MLKARTALPAGLLLSSVLALGGCGQILGLGSLHDEPDEAGTVEAGLDGSVDSGHADSGAPDVTVDTGKEDSATDATVDSSDSAATDTGALDSGSDTAVPPDSACATPCDDGGGCATPTDIHNCGACGNDCTALPNVSASGLSCVGGVCHYTCSAAFMDCNATPGMGCGTNITLPATCGSCTTSCVGTSTPNCSEGDAGGYECSLTCGGGTTNCGGTCADTQTNPSFCGAACAACPTVANGMATCTAGACGTTCASGYSGCGTPSSCQYDTNTDPTHCGSSCMSCPTVANGTATCTSGGCSAMCTQGYSACGGVTPCQYDTTSDPGHCGMSCGSCPVPTNGSATCNASTCGISCLAPYSACGGSTSCFNTNTDPSHCGAACTACSNGQVCAAGTCGPTLVWSSDASDSTATANFYPSVATGTSSSFGGWAIEVDQPSVASGTPNLSWQSQLTSDFALGFLPTPVSYTPGWQPSIAALSSSGQIIEVHDGTGSSNSPTAGTMYWNYSYLTTSVTSMTWPTNLQYGSGFRPRVAAIPTSGTYTSPVPTSAIEVHMGGSSAGSLWYCAIFGPTGPSNNGLYFQNGGTEYDSGPSQNPAIAIGPSAGSSTVLLEVHNDSTGTALMYRVGTMTLGAGTGASPWVAAYPVPSFGPSTPFGAGGSYPAVALFQHPTYGLVAVEVHDGTSGGLYASVGLVSGGAVNWLPAIQVDANGSSLPSIAIDPATGYGIAAHQYAGKIVENTFTIH